MNELEVLKKQLPDMAAIMNAIPGERFEIKSAQTILIIFRRMECSELTTQLGIYSRIMTQQEAVSVKDLTDAAVAYVKIKVLVESDATEYSPIIRRNLVKEFKTQQTKLENIIRLSKVNAFAAENHQKELIEKTVGKSENYLQAFEKEVAYQEEQIEKEPKSLIKPKISDCNEEAIPEQLPIHKKHEKLKLWHKIESNVDKLIHRKEISADLKWEETKYANSGCKEIPYYDTVLKYEEKLPCKDIQAFSLYKRKETIYFGRTVNGSAGLYKNQDNSLYELMNVNGDFMQFISTDLLTGEYQLEAFSEPEKEAMELYFNFICTCFEQYIGKTATVMEYLQFKDYYNRLMLMRLSLEEKTLNNCYRAMPLADLYLVYMKGYGLIVTDSREEIIQNIVAERNFNYLDDLQIILDNHVVNSEAKEKITDLQDNIRYFYGKAEEVEKIEEEPVDFMGAKIIIQFLEQGKTVDEAIFAAENLEQAVRDYLTRGAETKRIGIDRAGKQIFIFACKKGCVSLPVLNRNMKETWSEADREYYEKIEQGIALKILKLGGTEDESRTY